MEKKVIGLIRVSTTTQELESQKNDLLKYILSKGYTEEQVIWLEFKGASAIKINESYIKMVKELQTTILDYGVKTVFLYHLNRLGRIYTYLGYFYDFFVKNEIQVYIKTGDFTLLNDDGTPNPMSKIMWGILSATIVADTDERKLKTKRGIKYKIENNLYNGKSKFGYSVDLITKHFIINPEEAEIVRYIFKSYLEDKSSSSIAKDVAEQGYKFNYYKILNILKDECYCGRRYFEPIISETLFDEVKEKLKIKNESIKKTSKNYLLSLKLLRCPKCGHHYYHHHSRYVCDCNGVPSIDVEFLDALSLYVAAPQEARFLLKFRQEGLDEYKAQVEVIKRKIGTLEKEIEAYSDRRMKIIDLFIENEITKTQKDTKLSKLEETFKSQKKKLTELKEQKQRLEDIIENLSLPTAMEESIFNPEKHYDITHKWIKNIRLEYGDRNFYILDEVKGKSYYKITYTLVDDTEIVFYYYSKYKGGIVLFYRNENIIGGETRQVIEIKDKTYFIEERRKTSKP